MDCPLCYANYAENLHSLVYLENSRSVSSQIDDELLGMGRKVEHALATAMHALVTWDTRLARRVIASDYGIDEAGATIEQIALEVLATQPPLRASDLRTLN